MQRLLYPWENKIAKWWSWIIKLNAKNVFANEGWFSVSVLFRPKHNYHCKKGSSSTTTESQNMLKITYHNATMTFSIPASLPVHAVRIHAKMLSKNGMCSCQHCRLYGNSRNSTWFDNCMGSRVIIEIKIRGYPISTNANLGLCFGIVELVTFITTRENGFYF